MQLGQLSSAASPLELSGLHPHASSITHTYTRTNTPSLKTYSKNNTAIHHSGENDLVCVELQKDGSISQRDVTSGGWTTAPGSSP